MPMVTGRFGSRLLSRRTFVLVVRSFQIVNNVYVIRRHQRRWNSTHTHTSQAQKPTNSNRFSSLSLSICFLVSRSVGWLKWTLNSHLFLFFALFGDFFVCVRFVWLLHQHRWHGINWMCRVYTQKVESNSHSGIRFYFCLRRLMCYFLC